jgi:hypothetical protein
MALVDDLDRWAAELRDSPDMTYEIAIYVATGAERYTTITTAEAAAAAQLRDVFGTWVERIHSGTSGIGEAEAAHRDVSNALREWSVSTDRDLPRFAARWRSEVGTVDTTWMNQVGRPLTRSGLVRRLWHRRKRL